MGVRLVAASLPIYALGVALALFLVRQADPNSWTWAIGYGGTIALAALALLLIGGAAARSFKWRTLVIVALAFLLAIVFAIARALAGDPGPFWLLLYGWLFLDVAVFLVYPATYWNLWSDRSGVASEALARAAPLAAAVVVVPAVLGPRYWPESSEQRSQIVAAATALVALGGVVVMLAGMARVRLSPRAVRLLFGAVAILQVVIFVRGLPNPPMALASAPLLNVEYPIGRPDLGADAPAYSARLALIVRRAGVTLPRQGVYVRYRWYRGPDDPAPPPGTVVVTLEGDINDSRIRERLFAGRAARALIGEPEWRRPDAYGLEQAYLAWAAAPDDPQHDADLVRLCGMTKQGLRPDGIEVAPYVRAEREGGVTAAQVLYARLKQSPPPLAEWYAEIVSSCAFLVAAR
ncbi:MAG TPA: hypothetical protein VGQ86_06920 [Candidatus Limnocylindria bacterium]|nr:hypothetical protein [Candidatus Limnocylindria bacterium]